MLYSCRYFHDGVGRKWLYEPQATWATVARFSSGKEVKIKPLTPKQSQVEKVGNGLSFILQDTCSQERTALQKNADTATSYAKRAHIILMSISQSARCFVLTECLPKHLCHILPGSICLAVWRTLDSLWCDGSQKRNCGSTSNLLPKPCPLKHSLAL